MTMLSFSLPPPPLLFFFFFFKLYVHLFKINFQSIAVFIRAEVLTILQMGLVKIRCVTHSIGFTILSELLLIFLVLAIVPAGSPLTFTIMY